MSFYSPEELHQVGFASVAPDALVSRKASIYNPGRISIGSQSRIDDFAVLSAGDGGITIGRNVHIAVMASLIGSGRIQIGDLSTLSGRVSVYSSSDDYSGEWMTNPTVPSHFTKVDTRPVTIGRHVIVGCGSVILPGSVLEDGVAVGALSLVRGQLSANGIYVGSPARRVSERKADLYDLEKLLNDRS